MKIVIRADASLEIGSGHIMRCMTLAAELQKNGAEITFVCREHDGHLFKLIEKAGYHLMRLPRGVPCFSGKLAHAGWLGVTQEEDARQAMEILGASGVAEWLVVDHYALDAEWESMMRPYAGHLMVIDDLADRQHDCDLLLDQNLYADMEMRYDRLISPSCIRLLGPQYALLRTEFREARKQLRKRDGSVRRIFVFFGGGDPTNETAKALEAIRLLGRPDIAVDVVVGGANPHYEGLLALCASMPNVALHRQVSNIAELMSIADLAIGASGSSTWERCALWLPSIVISLAHNQEAIAKGVEEVGAISYLGTCDEVTSMRLAEVIKQFQGNPEYLSAMAHSAHQLVDAQGCERVTKVLGGIA